MMFMTACQQRELVTMPESRSVRMEMNLDDVAERLGGLPDGYELRYLVEGNDGTSRSGVLPLDAAKEGLDLDSVPDTFDTYFWIQDKDGSGYDCSDLQQIGVDYADANRTRGWFASNTNVDATAVSTVDVNFTSPFATVVLLTTKEDAEAAAAAGVDLADVTAVMHLEDGDKVIAVPSTGTSGEVWKDEEGNEYCLVYKNSVWVDEDRLAVGKVTLSLDGEEFLDISIDNMPLRKNGTSVYADRLLTTDVIFNITINPAFDNDWDIF